MIKEVIKKNYFIFIRFVIVLSIIAYYFMFTVKSISNMGVKVLLLACFLFNILIYDCSKYKHLYNIIIESIIMIIFVLLFGNEGFILFPLIVLDVVVHFNLPIILYLSSLCTLLVFDGDKIICTLFCIFLIIVYYLHYNIIEKLREAINNYEEEESKLILSIDDKNNQIKKEIQNSTLKFEREMAEEKNRISQILHDKLGHSVNGSIYQLEACKVLIDKSESQEDTKKILQGVIDTLRVSMDEIRVMLRKEKPNKKRLALLQLIALCNECDKKYDINAEVNFEGDNEGVPEIIWETILDNSFEAVSNALKYSKCKNIRININILNKMVRCEISDDGIGCKQFTEGMGIQGMKERVRKVKGTIDIIYDNGFVINMLFPFEVGKR